MKKEDKTGPEEEKAVEAYLYRYAMFRSNGRMVVRNRTDRRRRQRRSSIVFVEEDRRASDDRRIQTDRRMHHLASGKKSKGGPARSGGLLESIRALFSRNKKT